MKRDARCICKEMIIITILFFVIFLIDLVKKSKEEEMRRLSYLAKTKIGQNDFSEMKKFESSPWTWEKWTGAPCQGTPSQQLKTSFTPLSLSAFISLSVFLLPFSSNVSPFTSLCLSSFYLSLSVFIVPLSV